MKTAIVSRADVYRLLRVPIQIYDRTCIICARLLNGKPAGRCVIQSESDRDLGTGAATRSRRSANIGTHGIA